MAPATPSDDHSGFASTKTLPSSASPDLSISITPPRLDKSDSFGKYLIVSKLGQGGQAIVYRAYYSLLGQVALKLPIKSVPLGQVEAWVEKEAGPLKRLTHENIVRVVDAGSEGGVPYIATELVEGRSLADEVKTSQPEHPQIVDWLVQLADALHSAHRQGVIHRDLKPGNIIIGLNGRARIIDFGFSTCSSPYGTAISGDDGGTPLYVAPEQARNDPSADHRVDVFALGAVLKFLLDRRPVYEGTTLVEFKIAAKEGRVIFADPQEGRRLQRQLARIANRALQPCADDRYATAGAMAQALRRLRWRKVAALSAAALVIILLVAWLALGRPKGESISPAAPATAYGGSQSSTSPMTQITPAAEVRFDIHFQRQNQSGSYQLLTADMLPLYSGDRVQIHAVLPRPMYAAVVAVSRGGPTVLYPVDNALSSKQVKQLQIPPGAKDWLPLEPPEGTETLILVAADKELDAAALVHQLASLGDPPNLPVSALLIADSHGSHMLHPDSATRTIGQGIVQSEKGFVDKLLKLAAGNGQHVFVMSFPHQLAPVGALPDSAASPPASD